MHGGRVQGVRCTPRGGATGAALEIEEHVANVGDGRFDFTWTQHPAFGSDLLRGEVVLNVPRCTVFDPTRYAREPQAGVGAYEQPFDAVTLSGGATTSLATVEALGSRPVDCATGAPLGGYQDLQAAGGTALRYDPVADQFTYNWKTVATWSGTCRELRLGLSNDETPTALFSFR